MKRFLSGLLIFSAMFSLVLFSACGSSNEYDTPKKVVKAYFTAYQENDYEKLLTCIPSAMRDYLIEKAGGEEKYALSVEDVYYSGNITYEILSEEDLTDTTTMDTFIKDNELAITYTKAKNVNISLSLEQSESESRDIESTAIICIEIDGNWFVFPE